MSQHIDTDSSAETSRLLSELDSAIDQSSVMRVIIGKYERMRRIESITGPSRATRLIREEIQVLENRLDRVRASHGPSRTISLSPG